MVSDLGIERIDEKESSYFRKKIRAQTEMKVLQQLERIKFPAPRLLAQEEDEHGQIYLLIEDMGDHHLEAYPDYFTKAYELHLTIRELPLKTYSEPVTSGSLFSFLANGPSMTTICHRFGWDESREVVLFQIWEELQKLGPLDEPLVLSHGDYHPRNIMIVNDSIVPIDWEKAGYHSIYQDLYALIHMCYPVPQATLLPEQQEKLLHLFSDMANLGRWKEGYHTFFLFHRLAELVYISTDLVLGRRDFSSLQLQSEYVFRELLRNQSKVKDGGQTWKER